MAMVNLATIRVDLITRDCDFMLKHLPQIILSAAALFGMFININYVDSLSDTSSASGVEEVLPLRIFDWGRSLTQYTDYSGFISFALIGGVCAAYISRKKQLSLPMTLVSIIGSSIIFGALLGSLQNKIISDIGLSLVKKYPEIAQRAISTYYVQRMTWRDNNYKNLLIPAYTGDNIRTTESELFRVNMFYLVDDPILVIGERARGKDLMNIYFSDAVDAQAKLESDSKFRSRWTYKQFSAEYQTAHYDLRRISNTAVLPVVLATTMISLILSVMIFFAQVLGIGGGHWVKVRFYGVAGVAISLLVLPMLITTEFHSSAAINELKCHYAYCNITKPAVDWLFRFELGVVRLIGLVTD
jgi:hypothetical protein